MAGSRSSKPSKRNAETEAPKRLGCEKPRIFTPPLRKLEPRTSATEKRTLGYAVIDFAADVLHIALFPWQCWLLVHALELNADGTLRFRTIVVLVARQNGKSTLSQVLALWFMYVYGFNLILGTAQDLDVAEEIWQGAVDIVEETPELDALKERVVMVNGKKTLELKTGQRYKVKAASRRGGRGLSGDLILLDELREHQSWDAWGAITKTTMARELAQVWALSNAGDAASIVLRYLRKLAHAAVGDPDGINRDGIAEPEPAFDGIEDDVEPDEITVDDDSLGIFEWSAPHGCAVTDRDGWAQANPSLGHTITEKVIASAARTDPEWIFRTEVLCQWNDGATEGPFPAGTWEAGLDAASSIPDGGRFGFGVDVSHNRAMANIAVAGRRADGTLHVEVVARRMGTDWVGPWLDERKERLGLVGVAWQSKGAPVTSLGADIEKSGIPAVEWSGTSLGASCGTFYDLVCRGELRHRPQPAADIAAATARTRPLGDSWVWDRKNSPHDVSPLVAETAAVHCLLNAPEPEPEPRIRVIGG